MKLTPSQRRYVRRRVEKPEKDPSELGGELNIIPFLDIVVNLIMFLLITVTTAITVTQVDAQLPTWGRCTGTGCGDRGLSLSVTVTDTGIFVAGSGGLLSPGCNDEARSAPSSEAATVPAGDYVGLTECLRRVKDRFPEEHTVILSADPLVSYTDLVQAMDAARADTEGALFSEVLISAGVR